MERDSQRVKEREGGATGREKKRGRGQKNKKTDRSTQSRDIQRRVETDKRQNYYIGMIRCLLAAIVMI